MDIVRWAESCANELLGALDSRMQHVRAVARAAVRVGVLFESYDRDVLIATAHLHDIGYAPSLRATELHALDGARYLHAQGIDERVCRLVAHHSCAIAEAEERGLLRELMSEFPAEESAVADALWYCDMTTGPHGELMTSAERLQDIRRRYGGGHVVTRAVESAAPSLVAAVERTEERLAQAQSRS